MKQNDSHWNRTDTWAVALLCLVTFISRALFVYRGGMPDPDSLVMAAGMAMGTTGDVPFGDTIAYGRQVNPGMYFVVRVLYPLLFSEPSYMVAFLNWLSVVSFSLLVWPLYVLVRAQLDTQVAAAVTLLTVFTAVIWETSTYFHPLIPASLLLFLSLLCYRRALASRRRIGYLALGTVLVAGAFVIRVEVAFVAPALLVGVLGSKRRGRDAITLVVLGAVVVATYLAVLRGMAQETTVAHRGLGGYVELIRSSYSASGSYKALPRSVSWLVLSMGLATVALTVAGLGRWLRGKRWHDPNELRAVAFGLAWILPSVLFWLPQPIPIMRHYFLATIGLAWLFGVVALCRLPVRRMWVVTVAVIALNLLVPDVTYRLYNSPSDRRPKVPNGSFFYFHEAAAVRLNRFRGMSVGVIAAARERNPSGAGSPQRGAVAMVTWEGYAHLLNGMVADGEQFKKTFGETLGWGSHHQRYTLGDAEIVMIDYTYFIDADLRKRATDVIRASVDLGYAFYAPAEIREQVEDGSGLAGRVTYY